MAFIGFIGGLLVSGLLSAWSGQNNTLSERQITALERDVSDMLDGQTEAWNSGQIEDFMADYWNSPELRFTSNGSVQRGWQDTLARYQRRYPDRDTMGQLEFTEQSVDILAPDHALVFGRFTLIREAARPTGLYTLHIRKIDGAWKIVSDHTSTDN